MPEHYEVRRMAQYLKDHGLLGQRLLNAEFKNNGERILKTHFSIPSLVGTRLNNIKVKAKYTGFEFDGATVVMHYRFTGIPHLRGISYGDRLQTIFSLPIQYADPKYCRFTWQFESHCLDFYDTRCLSTMTIHEGAPFDQVEQIMNLPDDISEFKSNSFQQIQNQTKLSKKQLKLWLLDQTIKPSGIGNYLACEILAHSKLNPFILINQLSLTQCKRLSAAICEVSKLAARFSHYDWFKVFNRELCGFCGSTIEKKKIPIGAQTTHYCPQCQK
ncbi:MAG: DNA-formamidopyrimidine glycosylase family protein [Candidatus Margulisiibacteriota bacterium]